MANFGLSDINIPAYEPNHLNWSGKSVTFCSTSKSVHLDFKHFTNLPCINIE